MPFNPASYLAQMIHTRVRPGVVDWIGARPARRVAMQTAEEAWLETGKGLVGDRYGKAGGNRQVTLIQAENLAAPASLTIDAEAFEVDVRPPRGHDVGHHPSATARLRPAVRALTQIEKHVGECRGPEIRRPVRRHRTQPRPRVDALGTGVATADRARKKLTQAVQHGRRT